MQQASKYKILKLYPYQKLEIWDAKRLFLNDNLFNNNYPLVLFKHFASKPNIEKVKIEDSKTYKILGVRSYGKGAFISREVKGNTLTMRVYQKAKVNHLFWCKVDTKNGAFGIITPALAEGVASSNMTFAELDTNKINPDYLQLIFCQPIFYSYLDKQVTGTTNRQYIKFDELLNNIEIPLPSLEKQSDIVLRYRMKIELSDSYNLNSNVLEKEIDNYLYESLGFSNNEVKVSDNTLKFISYKSLNEWGVNKILNDTSFISKKYPIIQIGEKNGLIKDIFRGKSPKYIETSTSQILNQKCIRWYDIDKDWMKKVDDNWLKSIDDNFLTKPGDILINSTGEGTIGRAAIVKENESGLLYDSHILLLRLNSQIINPYYFIYFFNSAYCQNQIHELKSAQSTKQTELGVNNVLRIKIPLLDLKIETPGILDQLKIVKHISGLLNNISTLKKLSEETRNNALEEFKSELFN